MKSIFEILGIDDYEFTARYIPAFIFELLVVLTFNEKIKLSFEIIKEINSIFPLWIYAPIVMIVFSFPIKAVLRVIGETMEGILWHFCHPTIFYVKHILRESKNITFNLHVGEKQINTLHDAVNCKEYHCIIIQKLLSETRNDKKLREKLKEHGLFRNLFVASLIAILLDLYLGGVYYKHYIFFAIITAILTLVSSYYTYPKQLLNSFIEKQMRA